MALLFTLLLTAAACILGYFLVDFGRQDFLRETEAAIDIEIRTLANLESHTPAAITAYITRREAHDKTVKFRYENERGAWLAGTIDPVPTALKKLTEGVLRFDWQADSGQETFAAKIHTFVDGSRIIVARNIDDLIASYHRLQYFSVLIMFLMLGVILVSFGISYFVVSRINRIAATAQQIVDTGDLSRRIGIDSEWDDLSNLSRVLNGFLERIEILMHSAREVSNSIAHDLRTPLAGLRGEIETLKGGKASDEKIDAILADADRILSIFQAILRIANLQRASREQFRSHVDLAHILHDVTELYEPLAQEKQIHLSSDIMDSAVVTGDSDLLFQLLANLFDNAIKFSPPGSSITLQLAQSNDRIIFRISDGGPGIPDHEKEKVFRHFYRGDSSRHTPGSGLGLSLAKAIAEYHGAQIMLEDANPGLCVKITF